MGRPIDPAKIGALTEAGQQIQVLGIVDIGTGIESLYIVKQINDSKFKCVAAATTARFGDVHLQAALPTAEGEGRVVVSPFGGGTEYARVINQHNVKTFEGNVYKYDVNVAAAAAGEADIATA